LNVVRVKCRPKLFGRPLGVFIVGYCKEGHRSFLLTKIRP
jgi:hypothetical protein